MPLNTASLSGKVLCESFHDTDMHPDDRFVYSPEEPKTRATLNGVHQRTVRSGPAGIHHGLCRRLHHKVAS
jgi:hypothetical protein